MPTGSWADLREEVAARSQLRLLPAGQRGVPGRSGGIFAFTAVLGVSVYGISQADVRFFGVVASTVAAVGAVLGGRLDDRFGAKPVIVTALTVLLMVGVALLALSGPTAFWVCGLGLALF